MRDGVAVTKPLTDSGKSNKGTDSCLYWTWLQLVRTVLMLRFKFTILDSVTLPLFQEFTANSLRLQHLELSKKAISSKLKFDEMADSCKGNSCVNFQQNWLIY